MVEQVQVQPVRARLTHSSGNHGLYKGKRPREETRTGTIGNAKLLGRVRVVTSQSARELRPSHHRMWCGSASDRTTIAVGLREANGRGIAIVGQDNLRREVLRGRDRVGAPSIGLPTARSRRASAASPERPTY